MTNGRWGRKRQGAAVVILLVFPAAAGGGLGCASSDAATDGIGGDLAQGKFVYECVDHGDPTCAAAPDASAAFPSSIAVGGRFGIAFKRLDNDGVRYQVRIPAKDFVAEGFQALKPGYVSVLAYQGGTVLDFTHLRLVVPAAYTFVTRGAEGTAKAPTSLAPGETTELALSAMSASGNVLAGALIATWTSDHPDVVAVERTEGAKATLVAKGAGNATIHAVTGSASVDLTVSVRRGSDAGAGPDASLDPPGDAGGHDGGRVPDAGGAEGGAR